MRPPVRTQAPISFLRRQPRAKRDARKPAEIRRVFSFTAPRYSGGASLVARVTREAIADNTPAGYTMDRYIISAVDLPAYSQRITVDAVFVKSPKQAATV